MARPKSVEAGRSASVNLPGLTWDLIQAHRDVLRVELNRPKLSRSAALDDMLRSWFNGSREAPPLPGNPDPTLRRIGVWTGKVTP